jgi:hypothetical protein
MLADALGLIDHGEFLDPTNRAASNERPRDVMLWSELQEFLGALHADKKRHIIDLKINYLGQVTKPVRSPILRPVILELMAKHHAPVIRLHRNPLSQWVSGALAEASGVWNTVEESDSLPKKVRIEPSALRDFIATCDAENVALKDWCTDMSVLNVSYEDIFEADPQPFKQTFRLVSQATGFPLAPGWHEVRPLFKKLAKKKLEDNIENYDEIAAFLRDR